MIAHRAQLFGFAVGRVGGIEDGVRGPDANESIWREESAGLFLVILRGLPVTSGRCDQPLSIGRDMAAVDLKVLLLPAMREPYGTDVFHGNSLGASACGTCLAERV